MKKILVIEDDLIFSRLLTNFLIENGYQVEAVTQAKQASLKLKENQYDLVMVDFRLPDDTGINILKRIKQEYPFCPVILMTRYSDIRIAIDSIKLGALDYIVKPINPDELILTLKETFKPKSDKPASSYNAIATNDYIIGTSDASAPLYEQIRLVAPTDMSVIIQGESGTGKEHAAQLIHKQSKRAGSAFVAIDCGTLSRELSASELFGHVKGAFTGAAQDRTGCFETAEGGTLFLDEIGNLSYEVQVQLLRAIQERIIRKVGGMKDIPVNVRIIAATNEDLKKQIENKTFREDLYHRINEFKIEIPALRNRQKDLHLFIDFFLKKANAELNKNIIGFDEASLRVLNQYKWPGNLRELNNIVKRAVLVCHTDYITLACIPEDIQFSTLDNDNINTLDLKILKEETEREKILKALQECKYNKSKAAQLLNIDRKTLYLKMEKYGIEY